MSTTTSPPSPASPRVGRPWQPGLPQVGLALAFTLYALYARSLYFTTDDAWIDVRYAHNLAQGDGLCFNPGSSPVEAWTSPLWVLAATPLEALGANPIPWLSGLSALAGILLLLRVYAVAVDRLGISRAVAVATTLALAVTPVMTAWATGGGPDMVVALAIFVLFERLATPRAATRWRLAALTAIGLTLLRLDGVLWVLAVVVITMGTRALSTRREDRALPRTARTPLWRGWGAPLRVAAVALLTFAGMQWLRLQLFGDPIPWSLRWAWETASPAGGLRYVVGSVVGLGAPLLWIVAAWRVSNTRTVAARGSVLLIASTLIAAMAVGGEALPFGRLLLPAAAFGALCVGLWMQQLLDHHGPGRAVALWLAVLALGVLPAHDLTAIPRPVRQQVDIRPDAPRVRSEWDQWRITRDSVRRGLTLGAALRKQASPPASWATLGPGARGYGSGLTILDTTGRVGPEALGDLHTVLDAHQPTYARVRLVSGTRRDATAEGRRIERSLDRPEYGVTVHEAGTGEWLVVAERGEAPLGTRAPSRSPRIALPPGTRRPSGPGGLMHHTSHAQPGPRLVTSGSGAEVFLLSEKGEVLHAWTTSLATAFPSRQGAGTEPGSRYFRRAWLLPEGDVIAMFDGIGLVRLGRDGEVIWSIENGAHDAGVLLPSGELAVLARSPRDSPDRVDEAISFVDPRRGVEQRRVDLRAPLTDAANAPLPSDATVFASGLDRLGAAARVDQDPDLLLITLRDPPQLVLFDPERTEVVWSTHAALRRPYDARVSSTGEIVWFDAPRRARQPGSAVRWALQDEAPTWRWGEDRSPPLSSRGGGRAQPLPNGNLLVVSSADGLAVEVMPSGEVAWEWHNPGRVPDTEHLASAFQVEWVAPAALGWLP